MPGVFSLGRVCCAEAKFPNLSLIDARSNPNHPAVQQVLAKRLILDDGIVFVDGETELYGGDVMRKLEHHALARHHSFLEAGGSLLLRLLGQKKMGF